jgi:hypothetical protein
MDTREFDRKSDFRPDRERKHSLEFSAEPLGQSWPKQWPTFERSPGDFSSDPLGLPLTIRQVAGVIGCSAWTVRQKYVPAGLPHLRSGPNGKLIFYKNQVIRWLLERQRKGGIRT